MNFRKLRLFLKFHWVAIILSIGAIIFFIALSVFLHNALVSWQDSEYYTKKMLFTQYGLLLFVFFTVHILTLPLTGLLWMWIMRGGASKMTRLHKKKISNQDIKVEWNDVIGMEEAKQEAKEVVSLITDRAQLRQIGGKILKGLLMIGPPGCGKTYLAKAIATECGLPFLAMSGSEFIEMFVGVGASRIRKLFKQARHLAYSEGGCLIFIDEFDAIGARRSTDKGFGAQSERNTTINQLLVEMDGLKEKEYNITILAATNAPENYLDPALLRPGRFDRKIYVDLPNLEEREQLIKYYLKQIKYNSNIDIKRVSRMTVGKSPADISNLTREAALIALRKKRKVVEIKDISEAIDRIEMGIKHKMIFSEKERKKVAYHEAGHILATYFLQPFQDVFKASIASRGAALGVVVPHPREEMHVYTKEYVLGEIKKALGSYAAEKLILGTTTTGVASDFNQATKRAHDMVWRYGMGKSGLVGDYTLLQNISSTAVYSGSGGSFLSEDIKAKLNNETQQILQECLQEATNLLTKEINLLHKFANELLEKEELDYDEIEEIFREAGKNRPSS